MINTYVTADGEAYAIPHPPTPDVGVAATTVGTHIDRARRAAGWTTRQLAQRAGITTSAVGRILNNSRQPSPEQVERLCAALDIDLPADITDFTVHVL